MDVSRAPRIDSMEPDPSRSKFTKACPLEFHYVKSLFLQKQFRQCITTCREILHVNGEGRATHPLEHTFLRLYIALAHDDLARAMHDFSSAKLLAFDQAEALYREAVAAMPRVDALHQFLWKRDSILEEDARVESNASLPQSTSQSTLNSDIFRRPPSPSPFLSPPTRPLAGLPTITSPDDCDSEAENDFDVHHGVDQLTSPKRMSRLPSTFSSMSLLDSQKQSHALLRPVRPGSIAKPYQPPQSSSPSSAQCRSRLPRLNTASSLPSPQQTPPPLSSPVRKQLRSPDEQEWSDAGLPHSPVSPLGSVFMPDDEGTISPISPSTPVDLTGEEYFSSSPVLAPSAPGGDASFAFTEHLNAFRMQIDKHIDLLHQARLRTSAAQAERAVRNNFRKVPAEKASRLSGGRLQQGRSFWLFTPQDIKAMDKQRRIEDGRQRMWSKPRFDPTRYQELADKALAEL